PVLAQAPVFIVLFNVFKGQTGVLGEHLFTGGPVLVFVALLAGLTVVAWLTSRRAATLVPVDAPGGLVARLPRILPYTTVASALVLPMALVVYLLTSSAWTLVENTLLRRGMPG